MAFQSARRARQPVNGGGDRALAPNGALSPSRVEPHHGAPPAIATLTAGHALVVRPPLRSAAPAHSHGSWALRALHSIAAEMMSPLATPPAARSVLIAADAAQMLALVAALSCHNRSVLVSTPAGSRPRARAAVRRTLRDTTLRLCHSVAATRASRLAYSVKESQTWHVRLVLLRPLARPVALSPAGPLRGPSCRGVHHRPPLVRSAYSATSVGSCDAALTPGTASRPPIAWCCSGTSAICIGWFGPFGRTLDLTAWGRLRPPPLPPTKDLRR